MRFDSYDSWWWPYVFIVLAGWAVTDGWRFMGVYLGGRMSEDSELLILVRCVATAFVAAVIGNLLLFPAGALGDTPLWLRLLAACLGFVAFMLARKSVITGIIVAEATLIGGMLLLP